MGIEDEREIIKDFRSTLPRALKIILLSDKFYTHFNPGWDVGHVLGYITGSLSVNWHSEYVIKQTNNFKILTALQVLRDYLKEVDFSIEDVFPKEIIENLIEKNKSAANKGMSII